MMHSFDRPQPVAAGEIRGGGSEFLDERQARAPRVVHSASELFKPPVWDGRHVEPINPDDQDGLAAQGQEDDHSPGAVFEKETKSSRKTGYSTPVTVGNAYRRQLRTLNHEKREQMNQGQLPLPGVMDDVVLSRLAECPGLRQ
jgi:hypothetical protein